MNQYTLKYLLIFAMFLWGGGWSALKILTQYESIEVITFWRFFFMSLAFFPIIYFFKEKFLFNFQSLFYVVLSSFLNIAFMFFSYIGVKEGLAGAGSVIITTLSPLLTFLIIWIIFQRKLAFFEMIGLLVGFIGALILLELDNYVVFLNGGNIYFLVAAFIWSFITILAQYSHKHIHPIYYSFFISLIATIFSFFYALDSGLGHIFNQGNSFWFALLYLSIFGQTIATTIFFIASGKLGSKTTSSFMFLVPLFALIIANIILDESLQWTTLVGGTLSIFAIVFINFAKNNKEA